MGAGSVAAGVEDAGLAVRALAAEGHLTIDAIEWHAEAHQVPDALCRLRDEDARRLFVHQSGAGLKRVAEVQLGRVVRADGGGDAALGVARVALVDGALGQHEHSSVLASQQRGVQPRNARTSDDVVVAHGGAGVLQFARCFVR